MIIEGLAKTQRPEWIDGLPPADCWLKDPAKKIETPLDERGLVDVPRLIAGVHSYIRPEFLWPDCPSKHHLYWYARWYEELQVRSDGVIPAQHFRELPMNILDAPRMFHTVLHVVTIPPPIPEPEIMTYQTEAWNTVSNLFAAVSKRLRLVQSTNRHISQHQLKAERLRIAEEYMAQESARLFSGIAMHFDALEKIPEQHRPINLNASDEEIAISVGRLLKKGYRQIGGVVAKERRRGRRLSFMPLAGSVELVPAA